MSDAPSPAESAPPAPVPAALKARPVLPPPDDGRLRKHLLILALSCLAVVASFGLQVQPDGDRVALWELPDAKIPPLCVARNYLGIDCPGCGLTRSFISLAHGDVLGSFRFHRLGWLLFALTLAQIPYRLHEIYRPARSKALVVFAGWVGRVLIVLLFANWIGGLLFFRRG